jgi:starch synthase/alpha-amylase
VGRAKAFYRLPASERAAQIRRIMDDAAARFSHAATARHYFDLYERMLQRPLLNPLGEASSSRPD